MNKFVLTFIAFTSLAALPGCETSQSGQSQTPKPAQDKRPIEERLHAGMTKEEVKTALGEPTGRSVNSSGFESWIYRDTAKAFIPFYAIGGGKFQTVTINFDSDGKVKDWASNKEGIY